MISRHPEKVGLPGSATIRYPTGDWPTLDVLSFPRIENQGFRVFSCLEVVKTVVGLTKTGREPTFTGLKAGKKVGGQLGG